MTPVSEQSAITPGFSDAVFGSQAIFRLIMAAMAEPGLWQAMPADLHPPVGLSRPAALALLTLADFETPVWLPSALRTGAAGAWLRFHCNCPMVDTPTDAAFAVVDGGDDAMPPLHAFAIGDDKFPDRAATILVLCQSHAGGPPVTLSGPGIKAPRTVAPAGLRASFWAEATDNARHYPLGADLLIMDETHLMGLPRSTRIEGAA